MRIPGWLKRTVAAVAFLVGPTSWAMKGLSYWSTLDFAFSKFSILKPVALLREVPTVLAVVVTIFLAFILFHDVRAARTARLLRERAPTTEEIRTAWTDLEQRFNAFAEKGIGLQWIHVAGADQWHLVCGSRQDLRPGVESTCALAAAMLTRFPKVRAALAEDILAETRPEYQWYQYLKQCGEFHDAASVIYGRAPRQADIVDLPRVSARKCVQCMAYELSR